MTSMSNLIPQAIVVVSLAVVDLMGIAVINGFKDTNLIDNTTATKFITGLTIFGTFVGVLVLAIVGKVVIGLFKSGKGGEF